MTEYPLPPQRQPEFTAPYAPPAPPAPPVPQRRAGRRRAVIAGIGALAVTGGAVGLGFAVTGGRTVQGTGTVAAGSTILPRWGTGFGSNGNGSSDPFAGGWGFGGFGGPTNGSGGSTNGNGGSPNGRGGASSSGSSGQQQASAAEQVGVVDINTLLGYQNAEAAGTGTVVTPNGEILTNNHVIDGATKIRVTVVSTGKTYTAKVVGTDPTADVAVLQLVGRLRAADGELRHGPQPGRGRARDRRRQRRRCRWHAERGPGQDHLAGQGDHRQ